MGAFAWQLCCRAHARAYYDHAVFHHHVQLLWRGDMSVNATSEGQQTDYRRHKPQVRFPPQKGCGAGGRFRPHFGR